MYRSTFSPTGNLTLNDLRFALINFICAKQTGKAWIVRIEDGDRARCIAGKDEEILDMLPLFGLTYSTLYYQSSNFKYHLQFASTLLDKKKAFICFCPADKVAPYDGPCENLSSEEVLNNPRPFVIRMKKSEHILDSFIIMGTDKYPTRIFASACDDMLQGVTTIIQDSRYQEDAPKEEWVRQSFGYDQALSYLHLPAFQSDESDVKKLLNEGFMPEAIVNYLLSLGNTTPTEIFSLNEAIAWFDVNKLSATSFVFDLAKLQFINCEHIKRLDDMELSKRIGYACENVGKLAKMYTCECNTTHEIKEKIDALFAKKEPLSEWKEESLLLQKLILEAPYFEHFEDFKSHLLNASQLHDNAFLAPLSFWLTGAHRGLELALVYPLIKTYLKEIVR